MGKKTHDDVLDAALDKAATCVTMSACSAEPANFAGIAAVKLADVTLTAGDGNGDYVIADDTSGRKCTVQAQNAVPVDTGGDANHVVLDDGATLLITTTCTTQTLTGGNTVNFPAWKIAIADPT